METQYQNFSTHLRKFIEDLDRYVPGGQGIRNFLQVFNNLDMTKVVKRFHQIMKVNQEQLAAKDETMFSSPIVLFPDVNLSSYWSKLTGGQKAKIWTHLMILFIQSEILTSTPESSPQSSSSSQTSQTTVSTSKQGTTTDQSDDTTDKKEVKKEVKAVQVAKLPENFNPFIGVGGDSKDYAVDDLVAGIQSLPDDQPSVGVGAIAKLVGLDKVFNMEELQEQLKNMDEEDIKQATESIKGMLGSNVDEKTSNIMSEMLKNIAEELQKGDLKDGNPFDSLSRIADTVSQKIRPKFEEEGVDMNTLWQSTRNMSGQLKDKQGNPLFSGGPNPFDMLNRVMNGQMSEQECLNNCNTMLRGMGVDPNQVMRQHQNQPSRSQKKAGRRYPRK